MLRAGVLALAITASSLDDSEFDAEAWKAQKDEELKFLLKVRELEQRGAARLRGLLERGEDRWEDVEEIVRPKGTEEEAKTV